MGSDGIRLLSNDSDLYLAGNVRGVLYALSVFLEDYLGCRWFTPDCRRIPRKGTLRIPDIDRTYIPPLEYRTTNYRCMRDCEFAMHSRLNGTHQKLDEAHGGSIRYSHFVHTFNQLVPPDVYFDEHPKYFSMVNGKRVRERTQLCLTNPDVLAIATKRVRQWMRDAPDATIFSVSQNDWRNPCECPACKALAEREGSQSGPILHFVNAIADAVRVEFPGKLISTLAYQYSRKPPKFVRPRPNVTVRLCSIECCFAHPLATDPHNASFVEDIKGWSKVCKRLSIWDYVVNFHHLPAPFPNLYVLKPNIRFFVDHGVTSVFEQTYSSPPYTELCELRGYVMAKLLWDPDYDADTAIDEFIAGYYGAAAPHIRRYIDLAHAPFRRGAGPHMKIYTDPAKYLPVDFADKGRSIFLEAENAVADDPIRVDRVRAAHTGVLYLLLRENRVQHYRESNGRLTASEAGLADWLAAFKAGAEAAGMTHVRPRHLLQEFYDSLTAFGNDLKLLALSSQSMDAAVIPDLGARLYRLTDKRTGRNWLKVFREGEDVLLDKGGLEEYSGSKYRSPGWRARFTVVEHTASSARLKARLSNGLTLERRITLPSDRSAVCIRSTLVNTAQKPKVGRLRVHPVFTLAAPESAALMLKRGARWERLPLADLGDRRKIMRWQGSKRPEAWALVHSALGRMLVNRVTHGEASDYYSEADRGQGWISLELWSSETELAPGQSITLSYEYEVELLPSH